MLHLAQTLGLQSAPSTKQTLNSESKYILRTHKISYHYYNHLTVCTKGTMHYFDGKVRLSGGFTHLSSEIYSKFAVTKKNLFV